MKNLNNWRLASWLLFAFSSLIQVFSLLYKLPFMNYGTVSTNGVSILSIALCSFVTGFLLMDWWNQMKSSKLEGDKHVERI